jgi:DUF4097 and DUF4098 domain-containing protein YvlB
MLVRKLLLILTVLEVSSVFCAADGAWVRRGPVEHHGRFWMEIDSCSVPVRPGGRLVLRAELGAITVLPVDSDKVKCQVTLTAYTPSESEARANFERTFLGARPLGGDGAFIELRHPDQELPFRRTEALIGLQVPHQFNLDLETQGGRIQVASLDGDVRAITAAGDIRTGNLSGSVRVQTSGGDINLGNIGERLEAHTAGGSIRVGDVQGDAILDTRGGEIVGGRIGGAVHARTDAGDIILRAVSGPVVAHSAGGQIHLGPCGGAVQAETDAGSILLAGARGRVVAQTAGGSIDLLQVMGAVQAETSAGHILAQFDGNGSTFGPSSLQSGIGDVQVYIPPNLPVNLRAMIDTGAGHEISSDFPLAVERPIPSELGLGPVQGSAMLGGGGVPLSLRAGMGNIQIIKLNPESLARLKAYQSSYWRLWQEQLDEQQRRVQSMEKMLEDQMRRADEIERDVEAGNPP